MVSAHEACTVQSVEETSPLLPSSPSPSLFLPLFSPTADMQDCAATCQSRHQRTEGGWRGERQWTDHSQRPISHSCCVGASHTHASRGRQPLPLLSHPLLALLLILSSALPVLTTPSRCSQPPPSPNCVNSFLFGQYYYYNASSPNRCLRFFHWGCAGENVFMTQEECMETCEGGTGEGM